MATLSVLYPGQAVKVVQAEYSNQTLVNDQMMVVVETRWIPAHFGSAVYKQQVKVQKITPPTEFVPPVTQWFNADRFEFQHDTKDFHQESNHQFKEGDEIICIDDTYSDSELKLGERYIVHSRNPFFPEIYPVQNQSAKPSLSWKNSRFVKMTSKIVNPSIRPVPVAPEEEPPTAPTAPAIPETTKKCKYFSSETSGGLDEAVKYLTLKYGLSFIKDEELSNNLQSTDPGKAIFNATTSTGQTAFQQEIIRIDYDTVRLGTRYLYDNSGN